MAYESIDILVVEDNQDERELTLRALAQGCRSARVFAVEDGAEALDFLWCKGEYASRKPVERPRVILLDLKLPKVSGIEVLRAIKSDAALKSIAVVVLTASQQERDLVESYQLGANSYIVKAVDYEVFSEQLSAIGRYWFSVNQALP